MPSGCTFANLRQDKSVYYNYDGPVLEPGPLDFPGEELR
jgi:hypothetical protein